MKKIIKSIALLTTLIITTTTLSSCFFEPNSNGGAQNAFAEISVTLVNDMNSQNVTAKLNQRLTITPPTKSGHYFMGYYDNINGGTCYINSEGVSNIVWQKEFPTTLYAHWGDISTLTQKVMVFDNEPIARGGGGMTNAHVKLNDEFKSALKSNFDKKIRIEYTIDLKTGYGWTPSPIYMYVQGYESYGSDRFAVFTHTPPADIFSTYTGSVEIPAADFVDGNIHIVLYCGKQQYGTFLVYYSRNLTLNISFSTEQFESVS